MMKRLFVMAAAVPVLSLVAAAQDEPQQHMAKMKAELDAVMGQMKVVGLSGAAMGAAVKGAPYSAVEVTETNQVLADGTRIHNEHQVSVYRDSQGRVRRETPEQITILDPVAGVSYFLNPKKQTATKGPLAMPMVYKSMAAAGGVGAVGGVAASRVLSDEGKVFTFNQSKDGETAAFEVRVNNEGVTSVTVNGKPADPSSVPVLDVRTFNSDSAERTP